MVALLAMLSGVVTAGVPDRLLARDAVRYLELTAEQVTALTSIHAAWLEDRASAALRASRIEAALNVKVKARDAKTDPAVRSQQHAELETICTQSQMRRQKMMVEVRALLKPAQITKLAALEQAFNLMPIVQSAQSVNLLSAALTAPPPGLPQGSVEVEFSYVRSSIVPLPGCVASRQVVHPEVDLNRPRQTE